MQRCTIFAICLLLAASFTLSAAGSSSIGMVISRGGFQVDNARVTDNATLFEGTLIQTGQAAGDLELSSGVRMQLASESRGRVFRDRLVLEHGTGQLNGLGYKIEARTLRVAADETYGSGRVSLTGSTRVTVAALTGTLRVTNSQGLLVASLTPGAALEFEPQAEGGGTASQLTGTIRKENGKFFLTDETTRVIAELRGSGLDANSGKRVQVNGSLDSTAKAAAPATQVIHVSSVKRLGKGTGAKAAAGAGAAGAGAAGGAAAGAAGAAAGISTAATVAVVGGVAAAGTVAGLGVTGSLPGQGGGGTSTTDSSR